MAERFDHIVFIVDDEEQVGKSLGRVIKKIGAKYVYLDSGKKEIGRAHV